MTQKTSKPSRSAAARRATNDRRSGTDTRSEQEKPKATAGPEPSDALAPIAERKHLATSMAGSSKIRISVNCSPRNLYHCSPAARRVLLSTGFGLGWTSRSYSNESSSGSQDPADRVPKDLQIPGDLLDRLALDEVFSESAQTASATKNPLTTRFASKRGVRIASSHCHQPAFPWMAMMRSHYVGWQLIRHRAFHQSDPRRSSDRHRRRHALSKGNPFKLAGCVGARGGFPAVTSKLVEWDSKFSTVSALTI